MMRNKEYFANQDIVKIHEQHYEKTTHISLEATTWASKLPKAVAY